MPEEKGTKQQVNVDFTKHPELYAELEKMVEDDGVNKSILIRNLLRKEVLRRAGKLPDQLPLPTQSNTRKTGRAASVAA